MHKLLPADLTYSKGSRLEKLNVFLVTSVSKNGKFTYFGLYNGCHKEFLCMNRNFRDFSNNVRINNKYTV